MKRKKYYKKIPSIFFILIILFLIIYELYNIGLWLKDNTHTDKQIQNINNLVEIHEKTYNDEEYNLKEETTTIIKNTTPNETSTTIATKKKETYEKKLSSINIVNVNFDNLKKINNEVKGWIKVPGTNINYPFVQTNDNSFYLTHTFDKSKNNGGWIFLDYRNNIENLNNNTILYAHQRKDGTLFGTLLNVFKDKWLNDDNNHHINISTDNYNYIFKVFSIYIIPTTSDYIQTEFYNNEDYNNFINLIKERSTYNFNTDININDKILTLSTCYGNDKKAVVHAKLTLTQNKNLSINR